VELEADTHDVLDGHHFALNSARRQLTGESWKEALAMCVKVR
jgi:hypothetical protein